MSRNCWIKSANVRAELKELFRESEMRVSLYFAENPDTREEHLESRLLTVLEREVSPAYLRRINEDRRAHGRPRLALTFKHITHGEHRTGADLGLIASLEIPGEMTLTKAVLVQSKRLHGRGMQFSGASAYEGLFSSRASTPQWDRLLGTTSSAAYFLFGPDRLQVFRSLKDFGTRVLTAQKVKGLAASGIKSLSAAQARDLGLSFHDWMFHDWMVDEFICCNTGDPTDHVIDVARGRSADYPVRSTLEIELRAERDDLEPSLF